MTALDILVLLAVGGAGLLGLKRGFTTEVLSLGAWVLAIAAVKVFHAPVSGMLTGVVGTQSGAAVLALVLIFGLTMFGGRMIARHIGDQSKRSMLGGFDRVLGLGFGAIKGLVGASLAFLLFTLVYNTIFGGESERPEWVTASRTWPLLEASGRAIVDLVEARADDGAGA
jgi:membrane protein required for colicin V production